MRATSRRSGKKLILIAVIVVVVLAGVGGGVILVPRLAARGTEAAADDKQGAKGEEGEQASSEEKQAEEEAKEEPEPQIVPLGDFTVNVRAGTGLRYLQAEVALSLSGLPEPKKGGHGGGEAAPALPAAQMALAKDRVVAILSAAAFQEVQAPEGREALKQRVAISLAKAMPECKVHEVLFTSFVMQ